MPRYLHTLFYVLCATILGVSLCLSNAATAQEVSPPTAEETPATPEVLPSNAEDAAANINQSDSKTAETPTSEKSPPEKEEVEEAGDAKEKKPSNTTPSNVKRIGSAPNMAEADMDYVGLLEEALWIDPKAVPKKFPIWDEDDNELILKNFKGKLVLLNFWATWCTPCALEMPELDALQEIFDDAELPIKIIALSEDFKGAEIVRKFYADNNIEHLDIYVDKKNALFRELGIISLPTTLLIDQEGEEILRISGYVHWNSPEVQEFLRSFLWEE